MGLPNNPNVRLNAADTYSANTKDVLEAWDSSDPLRETTPRQNEDFSGLFVSDERSARATDFIRTRFPQGKRPLIPLTLSREMVERAYAYQEREKASRGMLYGILEIWFMCPKEGKAKVFPEEMSKDARVALGLISLMKRNHQLG